MINNLRWIGALGAVYVACAAVGTAQAAGPDDRAGARGPGAIEAGATPQWLEALEERSTALNREYGLGSQVERRQLGTPGPNWLVALNARSDAMNRAYGLGGYDKARVIHADDRSGLRGRGAMVFAAATLPAAAAADDGFAWDDAAVSGAATLALGVLLGVGAVSIRHRRSLTLR